MCMPTVWINGNSGEEKIFTDTASLKIENDTIVLSALFGESKVVKAVIEQIDFMNNRVILKSKN